MRQYDRCFGSLRLWGALWCLLLAGALWMPTALAQGLNIVYPQPNQEVRGEITIRFEGVPQDGYVVIKLNGNLLQATSERSFTLNTFTLPEGTQRLSLTAVNAAGKATETKEVAFEVANNKVDPNAPPVQLAHWQLQDINQDEVARYRVFAESNANIEEPTMAGGMGGAPGGGMGGPPGGGAAGGGYLPAPLDWQFSALLRRDMRDVGMIDDSANIKYVISRAFQRQREGAGGAMGGMGGGAPAMSSAPVTAEPVKGPWTPEWQLAPETGNYFVKMVQRSGREINATRKPATIAIADLLPSFPENEVRPGSTWQSNMTFIAELSERKSLNVITGMTFTTFDNIRTPDDQNLRAAKLESRFQLPPAQAKDVAVILAGKVGTTGAGGMGGPGGGMGAPGAMAGAPGGAAGPVVDPASIKRASTRIARVLWFDVDNRRVLRTEDVVNTYFEMEAALGAMGGAMMGGMGGPMMGGPGGAAAPAEPTKVTYNLRIYTWLDDRVPSPSDMYNAGRGTAHARDSVDDPGLSRLPRRTSQPVQPLQPAPPPQPAAPLQPEPAETQPVEALPPAQPE